MAVLVQMWDPLFQMSPLWEPFARDLLRAQRAWKGELRVWLDPRAHEVHRWRTLTQAGDVEFPECRCEAETFNCLFIYYVDERRRTYPPVQLPTGNTLPEGLYRQWLNTTPRLVQGRQTVQMLAPSVTNGPLDFGVIEVGLTPGPSMGTEQDRLIWPSRVPSLPPVSPEAEAALGGDSAEHVWLQWPAPFDVLFHATGGGMDMFFHHHEALRKCVEALATGEPRHRDVLREAESWVGRLTREGEAPMVDAWLQPKIWSNPESALLEVQGRYGLAADTIEELVASEAFGELRRERVRVRCVQSWLGYFWWEFYQDLVAHIPVGTCKECGQIIRGGRRDRKYCTKLENPDCYRAQASRRQRAHRAEGL